MKRLINSFVLQLEIAKFSAGIKEKDLPSIRVLFATLCMQLHFEDLYKSIITNLSNISPEILARYYKNDDGKVLDDLVEADILQDKEEFEDSNKEQVKNIKRFMENYCAAISPDGKGGSISDDDWKKIQRLIALSSVTATNNDKNRGSSGGTIRDYSKFEFEGELYSKNRLALAVIQKYAAENPGISSIELKKAFSDPNLKLATIAPLSIAEEKLERTGHKRHFTKAEEVIKLSDGVFAVSTQWTADLLNVFIEIAKRLGYSIK